MKFDTACAHLHILGYRRMEPSLRIIPFTDMAHPGISTVCYKIDTKTWYVPFNTSTISITKYDKLAEQLNAKDS